MDHNWSYPDTQDYVATVAALTIAGSDSGGGAGIQADLKTFSALGVFGCSAITAITAQNTTGVSRAEPVSTGMAAAQITAVLDDIDIKAIKIGMLASVEIIEEVAAAIREFDGPIVLDPVMVAKSGDALLADEAIGALRAHLLPRATVLTPNLPEAATLLGEQEAQTRDGMLKQACALDRLGPAVLIKGGHLPGAQCPDLLVSAQDETWFEADRLDLGQTHGTGCTLAAALATHLAHGASFAEAIEAAKTYTNHAISGGRHLCVGGGVGPTDHFFTLRD